jgi:hypothetical protein
VQISAGDEDAIEDAHHCTAVVNAVAAACEHGRLQTAVALGRLAAALAGEATERTILAAAMIDCVRDLDEGVLRATRQ